jgi:hypothetical protein
MYYPYTELILEDSVDHDIRILGERNLKILVLNREG